MKEFINNVRVTGKLVKNTIEEFTTKNGVEAIGGSLILRTADNSEHEIRYYANKYKKDENKNVTDEVSKLYTTYLESKDLYKDIEHCADGENPDIISVTDGVFTDNDFKIENKVISNNKISAKFMNKVEPKDFDSTVLESKFEVQGIVESIKDEIIKDVPTGNLVVIMNAIGQKSDKFGKDANFEADKFIPVKMIVPKEIVEGFRSAGYYDGCFTKFTGKVINTVEITEVREKQAFGEDIVKQVKNHITKNEITSGSEVSTIFEHDLTQEIIDALAAKRKQKLAEVASGVAKSDNDLPFVPDKTTAPKTNYNPFAPKA